MEDVEFEITIYDLVKEPKKLFWLLAEELYFIENNEVIFKSIFIKNGYHHYYGFKTKIIKWCIDKGLKTDEIKDILSEKDINESFKWTNLTRGAEGKRDLTMEEFLYGWGFSKSNRGIVEKVNSCPYEDAPHMEQGIYEINGIKYYYPKFQHSKRINGMNKAIIDSFKWLKKYKNIDLKSIKIKCIKYSSKKRETTYFSENFKNN